VLRWLSRRVGARKSGRKIARFVAVCGTFPKRHIAQAPLTDIGIPRCYLT